ncbi:hypothetical protein A5630_21230 [Mycolicibacterium mucogenicum]|uniref:Uncharacterized protein n=1 Tax=Mycolicibacterium mucogenicum TaxID=56689 RepID=A0A1A3H1R2_MYCMU|nr:hypothetical protein A5630_21230 [Mycolicibacterium mucogenicum]
MTVLITDDAVTAAQSAFCGDLLVRIAANRHKYKIAVHRAATLGDDLLDPIAAPDGFDCVLDDFDTCLQMSFVQPLGHPRRCPIGNR